MTAVDLRNFYNLQLRIDFPGREFILILVEQKVQKFVIRANLWQRK
jgi:hypothetical protein